MHYSPIEPLEPRIAPAVFTVAVQSPVMEPEDGRTYELVFTITLSGEITADASVKFATADNSAESSGILRDYIENHGTLVFTPLAGIAEQTKEVRVTVVADAWREYTESMQMVLSEPTGDAALGNSIALGMIEDDGDSTVGIYVRNSATVEGSTALFTVALTGAPDSPVTFLSTTRNGTATASDFTGFSARESTIPAFLSQIFIGVNTTADAAFESSEQFHLDLTNASGAVLVAGAASASGTIYNDDVRIVSAREFEFVDEDGDLVNVRLSKGALFERGPLGQFQDRGVVSLVGSGTVGAVLAGFFEATLERVVLVAFFLALVLALAESVSIQTMTLTLQALRAVKPGWTWFWTNAKRELSTALLLAAGCGSLVFAIVWLWRRSPAAAGVISASVAGSVCIACFAGLTVPTLLHALKLDPKIAAGPVTLAVTDVLTLLLYFSLAAWLL